MCKAPFVNTTQERSRCVSEVVKVSSYSPLPLNVRWCYGSCLKRHRKGRSKAPMTHSLPRPALLRFVLYDLLMWTMKYNRQFTFQHLLLPPYHQQQALILMQMSPQHHHHHQQRQEIIIQDCLCDRAIIMMVELGIIKQEQKQQSLINKVIMIC